LTDNRPVSDDVDREAEVRTVAGHFTAIADDYQHYWSDVLVPASRQIVESLPMATADSVLDVGSGVGGLYPTLSGAAPQAQIVLTDPAGGMLRLASADAVRVQATADQLPFADDSFDVALLAFMLQYMPDPRHTLAEVRRVLRPGGHVGVAAWGAVADTVAEERWMAGLDAAGAPAATSLGSYSDLSNTPDKLRAILEEAGFVDADVRMVPWSDHPDLDTFVARMQVMSTSGRRFGAWHSPAREEFVAAMRQELGALPSEAFLDTSEVLGATARKASGPD
jgi:ubiquinone/menaquinone biosynthesis C-methylase UbiE